MSKETFEMEWDGIINDPERRAAADQRAAEESKLRMNRQEILADFHDKCAERKKERIEVQAFRYTVAALAAGAAAWFVGDGGIGWLAWVLGVGAVVLGLIGSYGFGRANEI